TVVFALAGSMVLSLTFMPALASLVLPRRPQERETLLMRLAHRAYTPILYFATHHKLAGLLFAAPLLLFAFGWVAPNLGGEVMPQLAEGALVTEVTRLPGTPRQTSARQNTLIEKAILAEFPDEVVHVWTRMGTAEVATDPMLLGTGDMFIALKPRAGWTKKDGGKRITTQAELASEIRELVREFPGVRMSFSQPIKQRVDEMIAGQRTDEAGEPLGDDL